MGCRGTIEIWNDAAAPKDAETPVVLYTHWGAKRMMVNVISALKRKERWSDPPYLSRIIFCEMIAGNYNSTTGYVIQTYNAGDTEEEIVIDCSRCEVTRTRIGHNKQIFTFKELINKADKKEEEEE